MSKTNFDLLQSLDSKTPSGYGNSQVLLNSVGGQAVIADSSCVIQSDLENRIGWNITNPIAGTKFNLYFFNGTQEVLKLGDLQSIYAIGAINVNVETSSIPFFHIYTKPTGIGDAGSFYHSKIDYFYNNDNTIGIGEDCVFYAINPPSSTISNRKIQFNTKVVTGDGLPDEEILYMVCASDSSATVNSKNVTLNLLGFNTALLARNLQLVTEEEHAGLSTASNQVLSIASTDAIKTEMSSGEQKTKCMGSGTGFPMGTQFQLKTSKLTQETSTALNTNTTSISTASLDSKITQGAEQTLTEAQQVLCYGEVTSGPESGELHPIHITNAGDVEVEIADFVKGQDTMSASFPVVIASDQSTLTVDGAVSVTGTTAISATALPLPLGASTEATLSALNTKVTKGEGFIVGGAGGLQQVLMYGKTATGGNNLQPIELTGDRLIVDVQELNVGFTQNSGGSMTQAGAVQIYGGYDDGLGGARKMRTLKTDDNGVLEVDREYKKTTTTQSLPIPDNTCQTTDTIDMTTNGHLAVYGTTDNTTSNFTFWIQYSADGVNWVQGVEPDSLISINSNSGDFFQQTEVIAPYVRFRKCNTSGAAETFLINVTKA